MTGADIIERIDMIKIDVDYGHGSRLRWWSPITRGLPTWKSGPRILWSLLPIFLICSPGYGFCDEIEQQEIEAVYLERAEGDDFDQCHGCASVMRYRGPMISRTVSSYLGR